MYLLNPRRRGSAYLLVLGAAMLVALIGVSSLMVNRVHRRAVTIGADRIQARELARTALDRGFWEIKNNPLVWRTTFAAGTITSIPFGDGTFTLNATDTVDGDLLNNTTDPVTLIGVGTCGSATYRIQVVLDGDGTYQHGSFSRVVN